MSQMSVEQRQLSVVGVSVMRGQRRTSNVDAAQHGSSWASTAPAVRRHGWPWVAQWFAVI
jgi:hypothetical protein